MKIEGQLLERWKSPDGEAIARECMSRLVAGRSLRDLGLGEHEGRVDMRGLPAREPTVQKRRTLDRFLVEDLADVVELSDRRLESFDLSGARLADVRFFRAHIRDCRFDQADCRDWRLWATNVEDSSFVGADLRGAALGALDEGEANVFHRVNFSSANMREIGSSVATYVECDFSHARLVKVDFQSSSFVRCRFAGELREVIFWDRGLEADRPDPNPMEDVDFTSAHFRDVEFRRLNLDRVRLPESEEHVIIHHYPCVLTRVLEELKGDDSPTGRAFRAFFGVYARWMGPRQQVGVFSLPDLAAGGEQEGEFAVNLLRRHERICAEEGASRATEADRGSMGVRGTRKRVWWKRA